MKLVYIKAKQIFSTPPIVPKSELQLELYHEQYQTPNKKEKLQ